jgi:hypothetical protein
MEYVRFRSRYPNKSGEQVGIFGLVNVLGRNGMLAPEEERFRRENNDWYDAAYPDPCRTHPQVYDQTLNPYAAAWFKTTATHLTDRIPGYLAVLDAHNIAWEEIRTSDPGKIVYTDECQVVAVPHCGPVTRGHRSLRRDRGRLSDGRLASGSGGRSRMVERRGLGFGIYLFRS